MAKATASPVAQRTSIDPLMVVVAVTASVAFYPAIFGGFVWDDAFYVKNNPLLHSPMLASLAAIATSVAVGNYHPLTVASLAFDNALFGPGPLVFHVTNVLLHAANAVLVGRLFLVLGIRRDAAWAGALLWAVHPLRVESVAWISGRKDVLYVFFFLSALLAYVRHARTGAGMGRFYGLSLVLFVCSALSKGMAVAFVPVMFLVDGYVGRRITVRSIVEKLPFVVLALVFGAVAVIAQATAGAIPLTHGYGLAERFALACYGLGFYVVKTLAPWALSAFYPYPAAASGGLPRVVIFSVFAVAAVVAAAVLKRKSFPAAAFAVGFYLATVVLVLQVFPVGSAVAADRYTYLSGIAASFLIAAALCAVPFRRWIAATVLVAALLLSGATWARCRVWHDGLTLWSDVLSKYPGVAFAHLNRGIARAERGDGRGAIVDYDQALALSPGFAEAWASRAASKADLGDLEGASADLREAIRISPTRAIYRFNLGLILGDEGRWDEAIASLSESIRLKPDFAEAYLNRGLALEQSGRAAKGATDVRRAKALGYPVSPEVLRRFE